MQSQNGAVFNRYERKFVLTRQQHDQLLKLLGSQVVVDKYGKSVICSLYYDTQDGLLINRSIDKPVYKEKLRIRCYGVPAPDSKAFLEIKRKFKGFGNKRRVAMKLSKCLDYLDRGIYPQDKDCQILREIDYLIHQVDLRPAAFVACDRTAYEAPQMPGFRMTMDSGLRGRIDHPNMDMGDAGWMFFGGVDDLYLMEVKVPEGVPMWLTQAMKQLNILPSSYSKYGKMFELSRSHGRLPGQWHPGALNIPEPQDV